MADISRSLYKNLTYENYKVKGIDGIEVRKSNNTVAHAGTGNNNYVMRGNYMAEGMSAGSLLTAVNNLSNKIKNIQFTPAEAGIKGNPCVEVGDTLTFLTDEDTHINTVVMQRTLTGIQELTDSIEAESPEYLNNNLSDTQADINGINSTLSDFEYRLEALEAGGGGTQIVSVPTLPTNPDPNIVYAVQGIVVVN